MAGNDTGALAVVDQALAKIGGHLDSQVPALEAAIREQGYERALTAYFRVLCDTQPPDALAALAAMAIGRLALARQGGGAS